MCGNSSGPTQMASLSTATGYVDTTTLLAGRAQGNKLVIGLLVLNITSAATLTVYAEISYDGGQTWKAGANTTATAVGPKELTLSAVDAGMFRIRAELAGTSQWCWLSFTPNWSCQ